MNNIYKINEYEQNGQVQYELIVDGVIIDANMNEREQAFELLDELESNNPGLKFVAG